MCGEHRSIVGIGVACQGSSPHVRGAPFVDRFVISRSGIIPACAGSTGSRMDAHDEPRDHPRMCGEHSSGRHELCNGSGSSPHVRGARRFYSSRWQAMGIIPACAGSTRKRQAHGTCRGDHPRMCGEHFWLIVCRVPFPGSSPHVRGARQGCARVGAYHGIIPACAGSTPA